MRGGQVLEAHDCPIASGYRVFRPTSTRNDTPLVVVHGNSRGAGRIFRSFLPAAMRAGIPLIAPHFPRSTHATYQGLSGSDGPWAAADDLESVLADAQDCHGLATRVVNLLGFSGGAQFAHRYALVNPARIDKLIVASAGWYTYLDESLPFPRGLAVPSGSQRTPQPREFLTIPTLVVVGEYDTDLGGALRHSDWLDGTQGPNRITRALRWMDHLEDQARQRAVPQQQLSFELLPDTTHSQTEAVEKGGLADLTIAFVSEEPSP